MIGFPTNPWSRLPLWPIPVAAGALFLAGALTGWKLHKAPPQADVTCPAQTERVVTIKEQGPIQWRDRVVNQDRVRTVTKLVEGKPVQIVEYRNRDVVTEKVVTKEGETVYKEHAVSTPVVDVRTAPPDWLASGSYGQTFDGQVRMGSATVQRHLFDVLGASVYGGGGAAVVTTPQGWRVMPVAAATVGWR